MEIKLRKEIDKSKSKFAKLENLLKTNNVLEEIQTYCKNEQCMNYEEFSFAITGKWSSGKSTFLNNFIFNGDEVLPIGRQETTSAIISIAYAKDDILVKNSSSGKEEFNTLKNIKAELRNNATDKAADFSYQLKTKNPLLENNLIFVDTPGLDDTDEDRSNLTNEYISRVNGVMFLAKEEEVHSSWFYNEFIPTHYDNLTKFFLIINEYEGDDDEEEELDLDEVHSNINKAISKMGSSNSFSRENLFKINAKTGKGFDELREKISNFIYTEKDKEIVSALDYRYQSILNEIENKINRNIESSNIEIEKKLRNIRVVKQEIETKIDLNKGKIHDCKSRINDLYSELRNDFKNNYFGGIRESIEYKFSGIKNKLLPVRNFKGFLEKLIKEKTDYLERRMYEFSKELYDIQNEFEENLERIVSSAISGMDMKDNGFAKSILLGGGASVAVGGVAAVAGGATVLTTTVVAPGTFLGTSALGGSWVMSTWAGPYIASAGWGSMAATSTTSTFVLASGGLIASTALAIAIPVIVFSMYYFNKRTAKAFLSDLDKKEVEMMDILKKEEATIKSKVDESLEIIRNNLNMRVQDAETDNNFSSEEDRKGKYSKILREIKVL